MDITKMIELLAVPILFSTVALQILKQCFASEKTPQWMTAWTAWIPLIAFPMGVVNTWLFAEIIKLGEVTPRTLVAMGLVVGAASIGGFEIVKKIPIVNSVIK